MAANLTGMFGQLNNIIGQNPMAQGGVGQGLLDATSMYGGNLMGMAQEKMGMEDVNSMDFMNQGGMELSAQKAAAEALRSDDPQAMRQAAAALMQAGKVAEAQDMLARAAAQGAKNTAILETGQEEIMAEVEKKKQRQAKNKAAAYAVNQGDKDMADLIRGDVLAPEAYIATKMKEKELYELSKGEALVDKEGNLIHLNPDLTPTSRNRDPGQITANINIWRDEMDKASSLDVDLAHMADAATRLEQLTSEEFGAGYLRAAENWVLTAMGKRDEPQFLRTKVNKIINSQAIKSLPPGPASDKDVSIVKSGFPNPETASKQEVVEYLKAASRLAQRQKEYHEMKAKYARNGDHNGFIPAWEDHMKNEHYKAAVAQVRQKDIATVLKYADNPKALAAFERKYPGINPEIFINAAAKPDTP